MKPPSSEKLLLTRIFAAQRRLRFVRGLSAALMWFAVGSMLSALALVALWNWDRLPGPWQWLASAGRPGELLWLPLLLALGGFSSRWLELPSPRAAAFRLDGLFKTQERLLTAIDWLLSEKPRTKISERLIQQSAETLKDEGRFRQELREIEKVPGKRYALLLSLALPVLLLATLPDHVGLPSTAAMWLSPNQVDNLTSDLKEEMELARSLEDPEQKLKDLLKKLNEKGKDLDKAEAQRIERELQQTLDQMARQAKAQESARQLLETLSQRAREGQKLSDKDRDALKELKQMMGQEQGEAVDKAIKDWEAGRNQEAAESLESLQQQAGQSAQQLEDQAQQGSAEAMEQLQDQGQEYDESKGEEFQGGESGQGQGRGQGGQGQGQGGQGEGPGDAGIGTTEEDAGGQGGAKGFQSERQSERTSDWMEEFQNLHPPERTEFEKSQTRVRGQRSGKGPRFTTTKEGRGAVTEPTTADGSGGLLEYQESAENALLREEIPADYRDNVRVYFETLDGGSR